MSINFDVDANANPILAPPGFASTTPLRTLYSSLGVTFAGPAPLDGGAILDFNSNFGVPARSGRNFLAFNRDPQAAMQNGGFPIDPETLTFTTPISSVSIYGSGGLDSSLFRMEAFDAQSNVVGSSTVTSPAGEYALLSVSSASPTVRVVLTEVVGDGAFVFDDLEFTVIPEPAAMLRLAVLGILVRRRARQKT